LPRRSATAPRAGLPRWAYTHSGSTPGIASFTAFASGATRSGFVYADRATTLTGFCQRTISAGGPTVQFRQNFDLPLHQGWNPVVADFSVPQPGHIVANLTPGTGPHEKWYFFTPAAPGTPALTTRPGQGVIPLPGRSRRGTGQATGGRPATTPAPDAGIPLAALADRKPESCGHIEQMRRSPSVKSQPGRYV